VNLNFLRNKKWNLQNDNGPPIVGMERTEDKDISKGLFTLPKKHHQQSILPQVKNWAVDLLAESLFDNGNSLEHRLAVAFWKKSGRRLRSL